MSFAGDLDKAYVKKVEKPINTAMRLAVFNLLENLVFQTPVDTGMARRNWLASVSTPRRDKIDTPEPNPLLAKEKVQATAKTALMTYDALDGNPIYIVNNLPYIGRLNNGWSQKVKPTVGWVDAEVDKTSRQVKQIFRTQQP